MLFLSSASPVLYEMINDGHSSIIVHSINEMHIKYHYAGTFPLLEMATNVLYSLSFRALTRNPVFSWIPAFAGMTPLVAITVVV